MNHDKHKKEEFNKKIDEWKTFVNSVEHNDLKDTYINKKKKCEISFKDEMLDMPVMDTSKLNFSFFNITREKNEDILEKDPVENNVKTEDLVESNVKTEDLVENNVKTEELVESNVKTEELVENNVKTEELVESNVLEIKKEIEGCKINSVNNINEDKKENNCYKEIKGLFSKLKENGFMDSSKLSESVINTQYIKNKQNESEINTNYEINNFSQNVLSPEISNLSQEVISHLEARIRLQDAQIMNYKKCIEEKDFKIKMLENKCRLLVNEESNYQEEYVYERAKRALEIVEMIGEKKNFPDHNEELRKEKLKNISYQTIIGELTETIKDLKDKY